MDASDLVVEQVIISVVPGVDKNDVKLARATKGAAPDEIDVVMDYATRVELFDGAYDPKNLFGFLLPTDASAIGRLTPTGGSRKKEFYFQCMIVKSETFFQAGANPTSLVHLALNTTRFALYNPKKLLRSFELGEQFACVRQDDLKFATNCVGAKTLAILVQALVECRRVFFVSSYKAYILLGVVFSLLPIHARRALSFSIGLTFRDEHETRLVGATVSASKKFPQRYASEFDRYLDLRDVMKNESEYVLENPWALYIKKNLDNLDKKSLDSFYCKIVEESLDYANRFSASLSEPIMTMDEVTSLGEKWLQNADSLYEPDDSFEASYEGDEGEFDEDSDAAFTLDTPWNQEESRRDGEDWKKNAEWVNDYADPTELDVDEAGDDEDFAGDEFGDFLESTPLKKGEAASFFEIARALLAEADKRSSTDSEATGSEQERATSREQEELNALFNRFFKPSPRKVPELSEIPENAENKESLALPIPRGLTLSPFAVLSGLFPQQDVALRTLDRLIAKTCERDQAAKSSLVDFWSNFTDAQSADVVDRVREEYLNRLYQVIRARDAEETSEMVNRILGAFDVFDVIMN